MAVIAVIVAVNMWGSLNKVSTREKEKKIDKINYRKPQKE